MTFRNFSQHIGKINLRDKSKEILSKVNVIPQSLDCTRLLKKSSKKC